MEKWKDISGYEGYYEVSNKGQLRSKDRVITNKHGDSFRYKGRVMAQQDCHGYRRSPLTKNGKSKLFFIHRLVAEAFIDNPYGKPEVNHINGVKHDNRLENLEWCTGGENQKHAISIGLKKRIGKTTIRPKKVYQYCKEGQLLGEYQSVNEAYRQTGVSNGSISECASMGRLKSAGGFVWRYEKEHLKLRETGH